MTDNLFQTASGRSEDSAIDFCEGWKFGGKALPGKAAKPDFDDSTWQNVTIPHTWNIDDAQDGNANYSRIRHWYRKTMVWEKKFDGKKVFIEFLGANTTTDLYINGKHVYLNPQEKIYRHMGGYTAFRFDITDYLDSGGTNLFAVCVDNSRNESIAPITGDFNIFGGIYRKVYLIVTDKIHIDLMDNGSNGLFITLPDVRSMERPENLGEANIRTKIVNESKSDKYLTVSININGENAPVIADEKVFVRAGTAYTFSKNVKIENPHLWNGIEFEENSKNDDTGYMYKVSLAVKDEEKTVDEVKDQFGFRYFYVDKNTGFYLNGKKHALHGVNRHQQKYNMGNAVTHVEHENDIQAMMEMGCNSVRLCHYPQADYMYDLCDKYGLIVWTEIPVVNRFGSSEKFPQVTEGQLTELIRQQYNRPCICFWGLQNEVGNDATSNEFMTMKELMNNLDALAKKEDTSGRYTTQAVNQNYSMNQNDDTVYDRTQDRNNTGWKSDLIAWNVYPGWYSNFGPTMENVMEEKRKFDSRPMGISEFGWGANINQHEESPALNKNGLSPYGAWHPEEYQNLMHEQALRYFEKKDYLWATFIWAMFDFAVDTRNEGGQKGLNDKGLITADRKVKKDSFYLYKANWNKKNKFVYIAGRRFTERKNDTVKMKVYSNCSSVKLRINNSDYKEMTNKGCGIFELEIKLVPGKNTVNAETSFNASSFNDTVELMYVNAV